MDEIREVIEDGKVRFKMRVSTKMEEYRWRTALDKEPETISWLKSFSPHDVFFDVGANVGVYSLFAASLYPEMMILAFEPMKANYEALRENIRMNGFSNIYPIRAAIGRERAFVNFDSKGLETGGSGGQAGEKGDPVSMLSADDLGMDIDHVKIDIDGQELEVVKGMQKTLPRIKSILIEVSKASKGPIMDILTTAGFTTDNRFNAMTPHSSDRRAAEGIDAENIVFTR
jgi:FkbM family methyltransferase